MHLPYIPKAIQEEIDLLGYPKDLEHHYLACELIASRYRNKVPTTLDIDLYYDQMALVMRNHEVHVCG